MKKILFLIHDLGPGGAEKVLVNLVNNMDHTKFDITVMSLFDEGVNRQFLSPKVTYKYCFKKMIRGNSHIMKLLSPQALHRWLIKDHYDVEIAYLEGPCARIISGCSNPNTKLVSWVHCTMHTQKEVALGFRSFDEACLCYARMDMMVFVSQTVRDAFLRSCPYPGKSAVLYNTNESTKILQLASEPVNLSAKSFTWCGVGKVTSNKGFDRMICIQKRMNDDNLPSHLYILGSGPLESELLALAKELDISDRVTFLGYQTNPYQYVAKCDLFVCASHSEGFSTAATEALIVGTPVCTVDVSGMKEMLGENNEWGIVTENDDEALYQGIKKLIDNPVLLAHYKEKSKQRGKYFSTERTVAAVEQMLLDLTDLL